MSCLPFGSVPLEFAQCIVTAYRDGVPVDTVRVAWSIDEAIAEAKQLGSRFDNVVVKNLENVVVWKLR